jgi:protein-tyrosine phosphatase
MRTPSSRQISWEGCQNVRDLGGLHTHTGHTTRWRSLIRADLLGKLTAQGWQQCYADGVRTIIDLRGAEETQAHPYTIGLPTGQQPAIAYQSLPIEEFYPHVSALIQQASGRAEVYSIILENYHPSIARIMRHIIAAPEGGIVFHCHGGKDRTGTIAALLLDLVGVPHDIIAADYAESQYNLAAPPPKPGEQATFWNQQTATADVILTVLARLHQRYGNTAAYLQHAGLTTNELHQLHERI